MTPAMDNLLLIFVASTSYLHTNKDIGRIVVTYCHGNLDGREAVVCCHGSPDGREAVVCCHGNRGGASGGRLHVSIVHQLRCGAAACVYPPPPPLATSVYFYL